MARQGPAHVLADQFRRVLTPGLECGQHFGIAGRVAQGDGNVAQPAHIADAVDRRAAHAGVELLRGPGEQLAQARRIEPVAHLEVGVRRRAGVAIPGADQLAIVASIDAIAEGGAQFHRNRALQFDGEVGNAAPGVELPGRGDGAGRAGGHARRTGSAVRAGRLIDRQLQIGIDLAEEEVRAGLARDQIGVLADPAQSGVARQGFLEYRRAVGVDAMAVRAGQGGQEIRQLLQGLAHEPVVVAAERVARHIGEARVRQHRARIAAQIRAAAPLAMARHVVHLPVTPGLEPGGETPLILLQLDAGDADTGKTQFARPRGQLLADSAQVVRQCGSRHGRFPPQV